MVETTQTGPAPEPVAVERDGAVATVRLNRPDRLNALDGAMKQALLSVLEGVAADEEVRAVVLTGTGRGFSAGQDLKDHITRLREQPDEVMSTVAQHYNPIATLLATMPKPVIAAVNGVAAGAGASMAMAVRRPPGRPQRRLQPGLRGRRALLRHGVLVVAAPPGRNRPGQGAAAPAADGPGRGGAADRPGDPGRGGRRPRGRGGRPGRRAGGRADAGLRLDPPGRRVLRRARPRRHRSPTRSG